jgi:PDZ domain
MISSFKLRHDVQLPNEIGSCDFVTCEAIPSSSCNQTVLSSSHNDILPTSWTYSRDHKILAAEIVSPTILGHSPTYGGQEILGLSRPSFIFCKVIKPYQESSIGIHFSKRDEFDIVRIRNIDPSSPFARSGCLQPGDEIIAVNGMSIVGLNVRKITKILVTSIEYMSITVKTVNGDSSTFLNSIQKATKHDRLGINLRNVRNKGGMLIIDDIGGGSILSSSLLTPGHQLLTINDVDCCIMHATEVAKLSQNTNATKQQTEDNIDSEEYYHINILSRAPPSSNNILATVVSSYDPPLDASRQILTKITKKLHFIFR